jgi:hypothetical protein
LLLLMLLLLLLLLPGNNGRAVELDPCQQSDSGACLQTLS